MTQIGPQTAQPAPHLFPRAHYQVPPSAEAEASDPYMRRIARVEKRCHWITQQQRELTEMVNNVNSMLSRIDLRMASMAATADSY